MARIIHTFNFTTSPESTTVRVSEFYGNRFSMLLGGTFGGASLDVFGGDGTVFEPIRLTDPAIGSSHTTLDTPFVGMYTFNACCTHLRFDLTGGAGIDLDLDLFVMPRPE